jgi:hypothetical protein
MTIPALISVYLLLGCIWHEVQDLDTPKPLALVTAAAVVLSAVVAVWAAVPVLTVHP